MDKSTKLVAFFMVFVVVFAVGFATVYTIDLNERTDLCTKKSGVMVKTLDGWRCIRADRVQYISVDNSDKLV